MFWLPEVDLEPLQDPDAVQLVALVVLHVSVDEAPDCTLVGDALNDNVGAATTVTEAFFATEPPLPVHVSVYVLAALSVPVLCAPEVALLPLHPPDAVQLVAFVAVHVSCAAAPDCTLAGDAANVSVGAASTLTAAVCDTEPPAPEHVSV